MRTIVLISLLLVLSQSIFCDGNSNSYSITVQPGWNLLSLPVRITNGTKDVLFPDAKSRSFIYQSSYQAVDTLNNGQGFWLKYDSSQTISLIGGVAFDDTIEVTAGWNMIGGLTIPLPVNMITTDPPGIVISSYYGYATGYISVDTLQPGFGYWIKVSQNGKIILKSYNVEPNVNVLTDTLTQHLVFTSPTQDTLLFDSEVPEILPGQILISTIEDGLLRRVTQIDYEGGQKRVLTTQATLAEVFTNATIIDSFTITEAMVKEVQGLCPGIRQIESLRPNELRFAFEDAVIYDDDHDPKTEDDQVTASGSLSFELNPAFQIEIRDNQITKFRFSVEQTVTLELNFDASMDILDIKPDPIKLFTIQTNPYIFMVGLVPVVVTTEIPIYLGAEGKVSAGMTAGVKNTTRILLGAVCENGEWAGLSRFNNQFEYTLPSLTTEASLQSYLTPKLKMKLYSLAGPTISIKGYVEEKGEFDYNLITGENELKGEIWAGLQARIGVLVEVFDTKLSSWESPALIDFRTKLYEWSSIPNHAPDTPANPGPANSSINQPTHTVLSWTCSDPEGDPLLYDICFGTVNDTIPVATGRTSTSYNPGELVSGTVYYWKVIAKDNHNNSKKGPVWNFTTGGDTCIPGRPWQTHPVNGSTGESTNIRLGYNGVPIPPGSCIAPWTYTLQVSVDSLFSTYFYNQSGLTDTGQQVTGLSSATKYYWRVCATNNFGTSNWSTVWSFTTSLGSGGSPCPGTPTVDYAGKTYNTVQIGSQCWLKENLDVSAINDTIIDKLCYNNDPAYCNTYGGLYEWTVAMRSSSEPGAQGICPVGWHIPTSEELQTLLNSVEGNVNALLTIGQGDGTNTSGFSALLSGWFIGDYQYIGILTGLWSSSTQFNGWCGCTQAIMMQLPTTAWGAYGIGYWPYPRFSVRCVKD